MKKTTICKHCKMTIPKGSKYCYHCGAKLKHTTRNILVIIFGFIIFCSIIGSIDKDKNSETAPLEKESTIETSTERQVVESPIKITINSYKKDSVGGSSLNITITNNSDKEIKYVYCQIYYYNNVGDYCYDEISWKNNGTYRFVGPLAVGESITSNTEKYYCNEFNGKTSWGNITVEYMDGTYIKISKKDSEYYNNLH